MGVVAYRELPRIFEREVGKSPTELQKKYVLTLSDNTLNGGSVPTIDDIATALGLSFPTTFGTGTQWDTIHTNYKMRKVRIEEAYEGNPYEILVIVTFGVIDPDELEIPTNRAATWKLESQTIEVPALYYYDGSTKKPLTNSAGDYFQGLTGGEPVARLRYFKNFAATRSTTSSGTTSPYGSFPWAIVRAENSVNDATWGGNAKHTCRVESVNVEYDEQDFDGNLYKLWKVDAVIAIRASTWNLQLPDVGFNAIVGGVKQRAMVYDDKNGEWIPSPNPIGLDGSGSPSSGAPAVLNRRPSPEENFTTLFGNPPS